MMWGWHGSGVWWFVMSAGMLMFWALVIWLLVQPEHRGGQKATPADPEAILATRYARGEIEASEYEERVAVLHRGTGRAA
jgi:putative membrane protein